MEENKDKSVRRLMTSTAFLAEITLVMMGLSGISVIGVNIGFFQYLSAYFLIVGFSVGVLTTINFIFGIYILLYHNYQQLKLFIIYLSIFMVLQLGYIIHVHFFTNHTEATEQEIGSIIAFDVCFGLGTSALLTLCIHLKEKGSTIEMLKF